MDKKFDSNNLARLFRVENMVTPKTLITETKREVERKTPGEASDDIKRLLDEIEVHVVSNDIIGVCRCLEAIKLRFDYMEDIANKIRKASGL